MSRLTPLLAAASAVLIFGVAPASAQKTRVDDFAWLVGSWRGPGPEGATAEIQFSQPEAGVLPSLFRLYQPDQFMLLEVITLSEEEGGLFMYVRHFDASLAPLEEDRPIKLELTGSDEDTFFFENVDAGRNPRRSFLRRTDGGFVSLSELTGSDGGIDTIRVEYRRAGR